MSAETEQIKERIDIGDIVGEYVKLKRSGQSLKGLCPFHSEKTPSFIVTPSRGSWHCFGCNEGGDVFSFVQKIEGLEFPAALKLLADRAGVQLESRRGSVRTESRRQRLFDLLEAASRFYQEILLNMKAGERAKQYLAERGVLEETMKAFAIGYAPHSWDALHTWLAKQGFTDDEIVASGLSGRNNRGGTFDRFRGRIMFPIRDVQGRVVAFGGRIVPWHETGNEGKYVNSPETALYEKRRVVYNLSRAKKSLRASGHCIVVEGYMDVVMMVQAGVEHVVATSGTAFTQEHVDLLKRFINTLHFAFDGDAAGWKATIAATQAALASGVRVETILMPDGIDPADLAKDSPERLREALQKTRPLVEVLIEKIGAGSSGQKEEALAALVPLLRTVSNPIMQGAMIEQVADSLKVPERRIRTLIEEEPASPLIVQKAERASEAGQSARGGTSFEYEALGMLLAYPDLQASYLPRLRDEIFLDESARGVYNEIQRIHGSQQAPQEQYASLCIALAARAQERMATSAFSPSEEMHALVRLLERQYLLRKLKDLQQRPEEFAAALQELAEIDAEHGIIEHK